MDSQKEISVQEARGWVENALKKFDRNNPKKMDDELNGDKKEEFINSFRPVKPEKEKKSYHKNEKVINDGSVDEKNLQGIPKDSNNYSEGYKNKDYIISNKTLSVHFKTTKGKSKKKEWLIADVPCLITEINDKSFYVQQFTSSIDKIYIILNKDLKNFHKCRIDGENICDLKWYPNGRINLSEFTERKNVKDFDKQVKNIIKELPQDSIIKNILDKKYFQLSSPQGAECDTIEIIDKYSENIEYYRNHPTKRIDNMIFNRCSRWTPPIPDSYSYEEYKNSINFTLPIGTRPKDFCWPSELIATKKELIRQILCFKNIDSKHKDSIIKKLDIDEKLCYETHKCKWSGKEIDSMEFSSQYASKDNFIEICHRNPQERFIPSNMYWGFGESNRQQGGYSEEERVRQIARLIKAQPTLMKLFNDQLFMND